MGADERDGVNVFSVDDEELARFVNRGVSYVDDMDALAGEVSRARAAAEAATGADFGGDLLPGFVELIRGNNYFVREIYLDITGGEQGVGVRLLNRALKNEGLSEADRERLDELILGDEEELALTDVGVDPSDARKIAAGTPELFDAVMDGYISVDAAVSLSALKPSEQRNVLSTDLDSGEIIEVLDEDYGPPARVALLEGHGYRVRVLMLDDEQQAAVRMSDTIQIILDDDKHVSFDEIEERVGNQRAQIVAEYQAAGLSPDEAQAAYDDLVTSVQFLAGNQMARMELDGAGDDDSKPGDPDADNKFSANDAHIRAMQLLEDGSNANSQRLWQRSIQTQMGTPNIFVFETQDDRLDAQAFITEHSHGAVSGPYNSRAAYIDTGDVAAEIQAVRRIDPQRAAALELAVLDKLDDDDRQQFIEDMATQTRQEQITYATLVNSVDGEVGLDQIDINTETDRILGESVSHRNSGYMGHGPLTRRFNANEAEYQLNELAKTDPALAVMVKQQLDAELEPADVAELNRLMGGGAGWSDDLDSAGNHPWQMAQGAGKNFANGFIFIGNQLIDTDIRGQRDGLIPTFELNNSAERGGAVLGTIVEIAFAGKGLVKIGAKWFIRNGDELTEVVIRNADEIPPPTGARVVLPDGSVKPAPPGTPRPNISAEAQAYVDAVNSNKQWSWREILPGLPRSQQAAVRAEARASGLLPTIPKKPTGYPDFVAANVVHSHRQLPRNLWGESIRKQEKWLNDTFYGGNQPPGYTWHHSEISGRMELVETGIHNSTSHSGGVAPGGWSHGSR